MRANHAKSVRIVLAIVSCVAASYSGLAAGQSSTHDYLEFHRAAFESAEEGSLRQLECGISLVGALLQYNVDEATLQAQSNLEMALLLEQKNARAVTQMQLATIMTRRMDLPRAREYFQAAVNGFDDSADSQFLVPFLSTKLAYDVTDCDRDGNDIGKSIKRLADAIEQLDDPAVSVWAEIGILMVVVFNQDIDVTMYDLQELLFNIRNTGKKSGFELIETICQIAEAKLALQVKDRKRFVQLSHSLNSQLKKATTPALNILQRSNNAMFYAAAGNALPQVREQLKLAIQQAKKLRSNEIQFALIQSLGLAELESGNVEESQKLFAVTQTDFAFKPFRATTIDSYYRWGLELAHRQKDVDGVVEFANKLSSPSHRDQLAIQGRQYKQVATRLNEIKLENQRAELKFMERRLELQNARKTAESEAQKLKYYLFGILAVLSIAALFYALIYKTRRLGKVNTQLKYEKREVDRQKKLKMTAEQRLVRMQRMESLGLLAGGIAHDFNNLLVGVIGNAELLNSSPDKGSSFVEERSEQIIQAASKATELSRQMLAYSGRKLIERQRCDLNELMDGLKAVLNAQGPTESPVEVTPNAAPAFAMVDTTQFDQIVLNLVSNAQRATRNKEPVVVSVGKTEIEDDQIWSDPFLFGRRTKGGEFAFVEVKDQGQGIPEDQIEMIFDPFFGSSEGGRGLGLAVVYGAVSGHDGLIQIESQLGIGTTIRVLFPINENATAQSPPVERPHFQKHKARGGKVCILVVDDEPSVIEWISSVAFIENFDVVTALNGRQALQELATARESKRPFTCVLLDIVMPGIDGTEVLAALESCIDPTPVIMMSGFNPGRLGQLNRFANVIGLLEKPFSASEFLTMVEKADASAGQANLSKG